MKRRHFLGGVAAAALPVCGGTARADAGAPSLNLLAGGPDGEQTSRWANACALAISPGFPGNPVIIPQAAGGLDGVTGANRLDALVPPDGKTAAILPGAALIAWVTGDSRVHFDPVRWVPVMAGANSGVLVARLGNTPPSLQALQAFGALRLAADEPESNDLAALLALERMGLQTAPVFGLRGTAAKTRAYVAGEVDAVFLCGEGVPEDIAPLTANGGVPVFTLGKMGGDGALGADPLFPEVPEVTAFAPANPAMSAAYQAASAAARLDFFMVLPRLTDPGAVAQWRQAAFAAISDPALAAAASASSISLLAANAAAAELTALDLTATDQAGLQGFIAQRFGAQPG